ncbi:hypothetical protein BGW38_003624 [Lunasporangiospora selenospora]|uniref:AB hydrolase-1 domain-containing protein n=1 Tax=Lunasporangiospora selenospora TaxID=979761 RepID=A0A9P6G3W0_9FUNG|nr:hypothetical protein BGW38_003624 [Lunasporangiospora selenospora]
MQRNSSTTRRYRRRASTAAATAVPYAHPAATQFLRLGVGIDHVDMDQSDEEDAIYHGIEHGLESDESDGSDNSDEDDEDEEGAGKSDKKRASAGAKVGEPFATAEATSRGAGGDDHTRVNDKGVCYDGAHQVQAHTEALQSTGTDSIGKVLPIPQHDQYAGTPMEHASSSTSTTAAAKGLPLYHEKFTKATQNKIHGTSPLSNVHNTITASSEPDSPGARSRPSHSTFLTNTPVAQEVPQIRRFAEKEGVIPIHGWKLRYRVCYPTLDPAYRTNGNGRNIVLFHGALSNLGTWRKVQQALADRTGCRVLSYDRVGHGLSEKPSSWPKNANPYKNGGVLSICQTLLETLGMDQNVILIGNGTGATVAAAIALSKPLLVRGLILISPSIPDESPPLYLRACVSYPPPLSWIYRGLYGDHGPLQQFYYKAKDVFSDPATLDMYMRPNKEDGFWRGLSNSVRFRSSFKIGKYLGRLTELPTLVMTGDVDDIVPTIETLRLFETLQAARQVNMPQVLKIVKHAGHLPQEEQPDDFIKVTSFFIKRVCLNPLAIARRGSAVTRSTSKKSSTSQGSAGPPNRKNSTTGTGNTNDQRNMTAHNGGETGPSPRQPSKALPAPPGRVDPAMVAVGPDHPPRAIKSH